MRGRGRPTKLTPETQDKIVSAIRAGNYAETAAQYAGISVDTYFGWKRRGEARKQEIQDAEAKGTRPRPDTEGDKFLNFFKAVKEAEATSEIADMTLISLAAQKDWKAAAWRLERKFPLKYGRRYVELAGAHGEPLFPQTQNYDLSKFTPEQLSEMVHQAYGSNDSQN